MKPMRIVFCVALNALALAGCRAEPPQQARMRAEVEQLFVPPVNAPMEAGPTHVAVVRKNADGTVTRGCVDDAEAAVQFLRKGAR